MGGLEEHLTLKRGGLPVKEGRETNEPRRGAGREKKGGEKIERSKRQARARAPRRGAGGLEGTSTRSVLARNEGGTAAAAAVRNEMAL